MDGTETLILSRRDLAGLMRPADYLAAVEAGFLAAAKGRAESPAPLHLAAEGGGFHGKGALYANGNRRYAALKFNGNFPGNPSRGLPTIQGVIILSDAGTGTPLAIMDSIEVTLRRTAAASALAARRLARPRSARVAICGCGAQALPHLEALTDVLPLAGGAVWDQDGGRAASLSRAAYERLGLELRPASAIREATLDADVIVTCTTATAPFLGRDDVGAGAFIAAVGADAPHKSEIEPPLMREAGVFVDVLDQCIVMGDLHHAVAGGAMTPTDVRADLAQLVSRACEGRRDDGEIIVFDSTGTAIEDVASAALAYERAAASGAGLRVNLGA